MPMNILNIFRQRNKGEQKGPELMKSHDEMVAIQIEQEAGELFKVLDAHDIRKSIFRVGDAPYILSNAISGEHIIQNYSTDDSCLNDILLDGESIRDETRPAWFALTTVRLAAGRVSKNWKEQLALQAPKYDEITGASLKGEGKLLVESSAGSIELAFDPQLGEEVPAAFKSFLDRKRGAASSSQ